MEPVAATFSVLSLSAGFFGLLTGGVSICELILSGRRWRVGLAGVLLSLTPWPLALATSRFLEWQLGLCFD